MMARFWKILWYLSLALILYQVLFLYPDLPERVASHFDFHGKPNGWMSKTSFLLLWILVLLLVNVWPPLAKVIIKKIPPGLINAPDKDYWYSTEIRKAELGEKMEELLTMIIAVVNIVFIISFQYTYDINTKGSSAIRLPIIFIPIIFVAIYALIYLLTKMRAPAEYRKNPKP